ncbi:hypothetical protein CYG48_05070 [Neorhizobium sp. SOG26]|uniref:hypothetical protein n=1 Tax=Neorhizobium sp. SOG26 TaxID=2060726 RepID=UPI000E5983A2|nr:hypothetical protein [Neorhizobium sp. SOG26]AXV15125.1 hypothetical protein CYG48_05070 [Neorhizobium sp. SOG26]
MVIFAGMAMALACIWIGMKWKGVTGGVLGFIIGAALTGFVATRAGVDLGDGAGCSRYSSFADDC